MQKIALISMLLFSTVATAAEIVRCGRDAFGNIVCLDKDGVVSGPPRQAASDSKVGSASGVPAAESKSGNADTMDWLRCGIDPFGNKVCRP